MNKANSTSAIIRFYTYLDRRNLALLCKELLRPLLEYGNLVCSPYLKGIGKSEAMQHQVIKIIPALKVLPYKKKLTILARGKWLKYLHGINKVTTHFLPLAENRRTSGQFIEGVVNCQNSRDKGPLEGNSACG